MTVKTLIKGGHVVSMNPVIGDLPSGDILIVDGKIAEVAPDIVADDVEIIDAANMIVLPGFVDTHRHVWQTQLRGISTDWSLFDYAVLMRHAYSTSYAPEDAYLGNFVGALEALNAGVTTIIDHSHLQISEAHSDALVEGLKDAGTRGIFCYAMYENPRREGDRLETNLVYGRLSEFHLMNARRVRDRHFTGRDDLLQFGLASTEWTRLSDATPAADEVRALRELDPARISIHIGTGVNEQVRFITNLAENKLLGDDLLFVHGGHLTDDEIGLLSSHGGWVSTTPDTELQMGMGYPAAERVALSGKEPSLGVDIVSNVGGDMFSQMHLMLQSWRFRDYEREGSLPLTPRYPARNILRTATLGGAIAAGIEDRAGSLIAGKSADIILIDTSAINMAPVNDAIGAVVFYANPANVDSVFVAGRAIKRGGRLCDHDWPTVRQKLRASRDRIIERFERLETKELTTLFRNSWQKSTLGTNHYAENCKSNV